MKQLEQFSSLLDCIYQGATDPHAWPGILSALGNWMGASKGLVFTPATAPGNGGFVFPFGISQSHLELWATRHLPHDLWTQRAVERGMLAEGVVSLDHDLATEDELKASAWYQDFLAKMDIGRGAFGVVFGPGNPNVPATAISLFRSLSEAVFTEADRAKFNLVFPHISRALGVLLTLRDAELQVAASHAALDRLGSGVLLFNADGSLSFVNASARQILRQQDGLSLHPTDEANPGQLWVHDVSARHAVKEALNAALGRYVDVEHFNKSIPISRPSRAKPYSLRVSTLPPYSTFGARHQAPGAIAFLVDPERPPNLCPDRLVALYQLTPAEAKVAVHLADAEDLAQLASELGVSANTLKTHVKRIYEKMGVNSRAAFVRALLSHATDHADPQP